MITLGFELLTKRRRRRRLTGIRSRCYDFLNIFAEKFCEKIGVFAQNKAK
jgi:hypothetical protein